MSVRSQSMHVRVVDENETNNLAFRVNMSASIVVELVVSIMVAFTSSRKQNQAANNRDRGGIVAHNKL